MGNVVLPSPDLSRFACNVDLQPYLFCSTYETGALVSSDCLDCKSSAHTNVLTYLLTPHLNMRRRPWIPKFKNDGHMTHDLAAF